jgi:hypothetical protein
MERRDSAFWDEQRSWPFSLFLLFTHFTAFVLPQQGVLSTWTLAHPVQPKCVDHTLPFMGCCSYSGYIDDIFSIFAKENKLWLLIWRYPHPQPTHLHVTYSWRRALSFLQYCISILQRENKKDNCVLLLILLHL